jgi:hypothetical protein
MRKAMEDCRRYLHDIQEEALQESPEGGAPVRDEETEGREEKLLPDE